MESVEKKLKEKERRLKFYHIRKTLVIRLLKIRIWINIYKFRKNFEITAGIKRGFE